MWPYLQSVLIVYNDRGRAGSLNFSFSTLEARGMIKYVQALVQQKSTQLVPLVHRPLIMSESGVLLKPNRYIWPSRVLKADYHAVHGRQKLLSKILKLCVWINAKRCYSTYVWVHSNVFVCAHPILPLIWTSHECHEVIECSQCSCFLSMHCR